MDHDEIQHINENRICKFCEKPLDPDEHGNRKYHTECSYKNKLQRQKEKYKVGNSAKLLIQKNEDIASRFYELDKQKEGIPYKEAEKAGLDFDCPVTRWKHKGKTIYFFDQYGYSIDTINGITKIFIYHESDFN